MPVIISAENDIKERLSVGAVTLIAARAGCLLQNIEVDRTSVDVTIRPIDGDPVCIDAQLKSSSGYRRNGNDLLVDLPINNYNALRSPVVGVPRILIVLDLHQTRQNWLTIEGESVILQRLAYWVDLLGQPAVPNGTRRRVRVPLNQQFTPDQLSAMMERCAQNMQNGIGGVM